MDFFRHHSDVQRAGKEAASGSLAPPEARHAFGASEARISLVRLRPRRAQLRFSGHQSVFEIRPAMQLPLDIGVIPQKIVRCARCWFSAGSNPARQLVAPAGSNRSGGGGNEAVEAFDGKDRVRRFREQAGRNESERRAGLETVDRGRRPGDFSGKAAAVGIWRAIIPTGPPG